VSLALVIFDCDGVLVDSEPIVNRVHAETMTALGYPITEAELLERFLGTSDAHMLQVLEREWGRALPDDYRGRVMAAVAREYRASLAAIAGIHQALAAITVPVCVASSGVPAQIRLALECVGLLGRFGANRFSASMVARGKPAPDLFLYAAARMGAAPGDCVVVEDSIAGIDAAIAAGMTAIGFCGGSHCRPRHREVLRAHGAGYVIDQMSDLLPLLGASH